MLEVTGLTKSYGPVRAVRGIDFTARDGRVTGFLGPNGAGKSTTMRLMAGLERPDAGSCRIDGRDPRTLRAPLHEMGVLLDGQGGIPGMTARDYLRSLAATHRIPTQRVDELLQVVGLDHVRRRRIRTYSLGMKQRLGLASALLGDPRHVILDEPVNGLDPDGVIWVRGLVRQLADQGRCVLLSSHLMSELQLCVDDLVIIRDGMVVGAGPLEQILASSRPGVQVHSADDQMLGRVLTEAGFQISWGDGRLMVDSDDARRIGWIAHQAGIPLELLSATTGTLEHAYLSLVSSQEVPA